MNIRVLATIPSTYALVAWLIMLGVFFSSPITINMISVTGILVFLFVIGVLSSSILINYHGAKAAGDAPIDFDYRDNTVFYVFSIIGLLGLIKYVMDFSALFGGIQGFFGKILSGESLDIRLAAAENTSIGFQLSYFSWISIFFGLLILTTSRSKATNRGLVFAIVALEFILNLTFIDRTRPMTIVITGVMGIMFRNGRDKVKLWPLLVLAIVPFLIFVVFSLFSGKFDASIGVVDTLFIYILGGLSYFDGLIHDKSVYVYYIPERILWPLAKIYEIVFGGGAYTAPSQILEFRNVPFATNVGTFLEPFYSDGGLPYIFIVFPIFIVLSDYVALRFLGSGTLFGAFLWSHFVYAAMISFFVSRLHSTYMFLFVALWFVAGRAARRRVQRGAGGRITAAPPFS